MMFDGIKVFTATKQKDRDELGETVTRWLDSQAGKIELVDKEVKQSSDNEYHCLSIILFFRRKA